MYTDLNSTLFFPSNILDVQDLGEGKTQRTYASGVIETFDQTLQGYRVYPDGTRERGKFNETLNQFICRYRIGEDGSVAFISPEKLLTFVDKSSKKYRYEHIVEFENRLVVVEQIFTTSVRSHYVMKETDPSNVLLAAAKHAHNCPLANKVKSVLSHKGFEQQLPGFMNTILKGDGSGIPTLFSFPEQAEIVTLEVAAQAGLIDPLQTIDPVSSKNLFTHAAGLPEHKLLKKLIELFPENYESVTQEVIETLIRHGHKPSFIQKLIVKFHQTGGQLVYHDLWSQIVNYKEPDHKFNEAFAALSPEHKKLLYEAAFACNNPYIYEPAAIPVEPSQYSINLMWINENKMHEGHEFLFGQGYTVEERALDFHNRFVIPVSEWAKKNPGTPINIWIDEALVTPDAIKRSQIALEQYLEGTSHGILTFRNVRDIPLVQDPDHSFIFSPHIPVYFRVDLLRAITADYTLTNKETQYFVYGDLDMKPLSGSELFDRRTIGFLYEYGLVMAKGGADGYENGFYIFNGANPRFMKSHRKALINTSIAQAIRNSDKIGQQQFYNNYPTMWGYFLREKKEYLQLSVKIPTKPVQLPPTHFR